MNKSVRSTINSVISVILALLLAFILLAFVLVWRGYDPIRVFSTLISGAFIGGYSLSSSTVMAIPLILGGLGIALSFRCGIFNIGGEGQLYLGALAATWLGVTIKGLPYVIHIPICLLGSMIAGAIWAFIPGYLKIKKGYNEVILSILLSYIGLYLTNYMLAGPFKAEGVLNNQSPKIENSAFLTKLFPTGELSTALYMTITAVAVFYFIFTKTDVGFKLRVVGANMTAARTAGISTRKYLLATIMVSGAFAGMAGSVQILGYQHLMVQNFSPNTGYDIISVAIMGNLHPIGVALSGFLIGALRSGATEMQIMTGVPVTILDMIQGVIILCVISFQYLKIDFVGKIGRLIHKPVEDAGRKEANS